MSKPKNPHTGSSLENFMKDDKTMPVAVEYWIQFVHNNFEQSYWKVFKRGPWLENISKSQLETFTHTIEYSAYSALKAECDRLRKQLDNETELNIKLENIKIKQESKITALTAELEYHKQRYNQSKRLESLQSENADFRTALEWLVNHAIDTASISKAKGAELLKVPLIDLDAVLSKHDKKGAK